MATYYRLSDDHRLPRHWAYCEAWEKIDHPVVDPETGEWDLRVEIMDNRAPGAQVWDDLETVLAAARGEPGIDGDYTDYTHLLLIDAKRTIDGGGQWNAVAEGDVTRVRSVEIESLPLDASTKEIERLAKDQPIEWHESLPCPWPTYLE